MCLVALKGCYVQKDPNFAKNIGQLVVLGGAFNASGNVNPAAEANVSLKRQKSHSRNVSCMRIKPHFTHHRCVVCWPSSDMLKAILQLCTINFVVLVPFSAEFVSFFVILRFSEKLRITGCVCLPM
jgi:hypothetical protein